MKPMFQLDEAAPIEEITGYLSLLICQARAVQSALHELSYDKKDIENNFLEIGGLIAQNESNLEMINQIAQFLEGKKIQVGAV